MSILNKFKQKEFMQNVVIEIVGDAIMLAVGCGFAYFFKVAIFG